VRQQHPHEVQREGRVQTVDRELPCATAVWSHVAAVVQEVACLLQQVIQVSALGLVGDVVKDLPLGAR